MNNMKKKVLAIFLAPIAVLGLVATMFTTSAMAVGETQQGTTGQQALASQSTSIDVQVRPWCGWTALAAANSAITLEPAAPTVYDGNAIALLAIGQEFAIKVGPATSSAVAAGSNFEKELDDNCSWFTDDSKNGVVVTTAVSGGAFTATSDAEGAEAGDTSMNFVADPLNEFSITSASAVCDTDFDFSESPFLVSSDTLVTKNLVTMSTSATSTNSFCSWTNDYNISIPAGMKPTYGDSTYTYVGPTITNTMIYSRP